MSRNLSFYIKILLLTFLFIGNSNSIELSITPLKKPILDKITKQHKITQGIIRPESKPIKKVAKQKLQNVFSNHGRAGAQESAAAQAQEPRCPRFDDAQQVGKEGGCDGNAQDLFRDPSH